MKADDDSLQEWLVAALWFCNGFLIGTLFWFGMLK